MVTMVQNGNNWIINALFSTYSMKIAKQYIIVVCCVLLALPLAAQNKKHYSKVYRQALSIADVATAASALNALIVLGHEQYKDTLNLLYNSNGMYLQSYWLSKQLLKHKPHDSQYLETQLVNTRELGVIQEALLVADELISLQPANPYYLYEKIKLLYQQQSYSLCLQTLNTALGLPVNPTQQIEVESSEGGSVAVPLVAEFYHIKGLVYYQLKDLMAAKELMDKVLLLAPHYKLAANNRSALDAVK